MTLRVIALAATVLLAGCLAPAPAADVAPAGEPAAPEPRLEPPTFLRPVLVGSGGNAAEPNLVVAPDGRVFVAASPFLWRSVDGGRSFEALGEDACASGARVAGACMPGRTVKDAGLEGDGDGDLATDGEGRLHWVGLHGPSGAVPYQVSLDGGATWSPAVDLAAGNDSDRAWIEARPDGALYVTWRDFGAPGDDDAREVLLFRRSGDGGATWDPARVVAEDALQGPLVQAAATGALVFAFFDDRLRLARSVDEGVTWTLHDVAPPPPSRPRGGNPISIFPVVAADEAGALYVVWSQGDAAAGNKLATVPRVLLAASTDGGETWTPPRALSTEGRAAVLPWIVAGKAGRVAVAWYEGRHGVPNEALPDAWDVVLAQSVDASSPDPRFVRGVANDAPVHLGALCTDGGGCDHACVDDACARTRVCPFYACVGRDRSRLDFFEMALRPDGHPLVAWVADADPRDPLAGLRVMLGGVAAGTPVG